MDNSDTVRIDDKDVDLIIDGEKYYKINNKYYYKPNDFLAPIIKNIKDNSSKIKSLLRSSPAFIDTISAAVPSDIFQAVLTNEQKSMLAEGTIELMTSKKGTLIASLIDPETKRIISNVNLEKIKLTPELNTAVSNLSAQTQMAQIAQDIQYVQLAVEEVRKGQENDRLAIAYSCKQKLLQAMAIENPQIRQLALMNLTASAEDSRNKLMLSQIETVEFLKKQPTDFWGKFLNGAKEQEKDRKITELRESMNALNMVSLTEAISYQELGEQKAANIALDYYGGYLDKVYMSDKEFLERLDSLNPSPKKYWSTKLPDISEKVKLLNSEQKDLYLEEFTNVQEK